MLIKKEKYIYKYLKYFLLIFLLVFIFYFKSSIINNILIISQKYFYKENLILIIPSEKEELESLRIESKLLKVENQKLREEYVVSDLEDKPAFVYLILGESTLYGDFYVSVPKGKTTYKGMNIFSTGNILVGKVSEISEYFMKVVRLGTDKSFIVSTLESEETFELHSLSSGLYVGSVSGGNKTSVGDVVVLKGYPKAVVGTVVEIVKGDSALSNVFVRTPYNINNKEFFYVTQ